MRWTSRWAGLSARGALAAAATRAGYDDCKLHTSAGEVTLKVPKLPQLKFETAIGVSTRLEDNRFVSCSSGAIERAMPR